MNDGFLADLENAAARAVQTEYDKDRRAEENDMTNLARAGLVQAIEVARRRSLSAGTAR